MRPGNTTPVLAYFEEDGAALTVAQFHQQNSTTAQQGVVTATSTKTTITPGQPMDLTINTAGLDPKAAIVGLLIWAVDDFGQKIGGFSAYPPTLSPMMPCIEPGANLPTVLVHNQGLDGANPPNVNQLTGLVWQAPPIIYSNTVTVKGLAVTDTGFGFHSTAFQVTGATTGTPPFPTSAGMPQRVLKCIPKGAAGTAGMAMPMTGGAPPTK
ncbi:hypothetical protein HDU76_008937 [Blyttiomyces sp. JEL0837]|nr:hypothetical protein HDU76_008937 [Blyttiomyces sp. JEL0837]